jgi:hypothetical protein
MLDGEVLNFVYRVAGLKMGECTDFSELGYPVQVTYLEDEVYLIEMYNLVHQRPPVVCSATAINRVLHYLLKSYRAEESKIANN